MESERENLDYYSDDPEFIEATSKSKYSKFVKYLALGSLVILGTTSAANINLGSNSPKEFGQGIALYAACSKSDYIVVEPISAFDASANAFKLTDIKFSHIPDDCLSVEFSITAQSDTAPIELDTGVTTARVIYNGASTSGVYKGTSGANTFGAQITNASNSGGYGAFTLDLTGTLPSAANIQAITLESASTSCKGLYQNNPGISAYQILQDCPTLSDGLYWIQNANINGGTAVQIYADMTRNGGGWTLVVANGANVWTAAQTLISNGTNPPTDPTNLTAQGNKYSILSWADYIKRSASGFNYRFEAQNLGTFGGTFTANAAYSFVSTSNGNTSITINEVFNGWSYANNGIEERMPWYSSGGFGLLTTSASSTSQWWGSLISSQPHCSTAAPYMENAGMSCPSKIWYWVR
ncbi:MAG: fibrinogen-like YCDxxxxGGGW domain-containing protein [Actinomycetes bacterium]